MGRTMRMDLRFFWCLWLPLGRAAKLLSGRQCHVDVFIVCHWQLLLPPSPLPGTAVSELQLTHLSRIRLVGCACESFGGCLQERGMCASGRVDYNCHAPVSDCLHLKMRRPSPPYPLYLPFSTFLCSCFSCCISFLMLTTCHIMQLHCHVAAAVELSFRCFSSASAASTKTCCFCYCCCCCCSCSCCCG